MIIGSRAVLKTAGRLSAWGFESLHLRKPWNLFYAIVAQLVEYDLAKVEVVGSRPICRSRNGAVV